MAPLSKSKAKRPSDASDRVPTLTPESSFSSTSRGSRRPSIGPLGPFQSPPATPKSNRGRWGQTSAPISRVNSAHASISFGHPTSDPEAGKLAPLSLRLRVAEAFCIPTIFPKAKEIPADLSSAFALIGPDYFEQQFAECPLQSPPGTRQTSRKSSCKLTLCLSSSTYDHPF